MSLLQTNKQTIVERIRSFARSTPNKVAIECANEEITYQQLENATNKIAHFLMDNYNEMKHVYVFLDSGVALIKALIGIFKSGGIFIPIDPSASEERIANMLGEVEAEWIITSPSLLNKITDIKNKVKDNMNCLLVDSVDSIENYRGESDISDKYALNRHCYIYFTSGSTGKPKCVLGRQDSLMHFIDWEMKEMGVDENSRVSQLTPVSFDPFLRDVLVPLCAGGTLCIPESKDIILNPVKLMNWIEDKEITLIHTVPSLFKAITAQIEHSGRFGKLKHILLAGELLRGNDIKRFIEIIGTRVQLVNLYGPTETTLAKMFYKIKADDINRTIIPVGKPIDLAQAYILNEEMQKCGKGIVGKIYIRTPFMTSGYCNDKELTQKLFIQNPFSDHTNDFIYNTGDLGRRLADDNIEVLGRADHQVKIRGMRIELGEIENCLLQHPQINEAVVIVRMDPDSNKYLTAFFVSKETLSASEIKQYLSKKLPEGMMPSSFVQMDHIPLNPNGKTDRKKLELMNIVADNNEQYVKPCNETEERLARIWSGIFPIEKISVEADFFELGGHSLRAASLMAEIYKEFNVDISMRDLFDITTIRKQSVFIQNAAKSNYTRIPKAVDQAYYEASSAQKRMYVLQQVDAETTAYNMPNLLFVEGELDRSRVERAFNELIRRHETLRTSFEVVQEKVIQRIAGEVKFHIEYLEKNDHEIEEIASRFVRPFNLSNGPLLRAGILQLEDNKHLVLFDIHHIISDATSIGRMISDFANLYEGIGLDDLKIQYKDYSEWQNTFLKTAEMRKKEEYWFNKFSGEIPVLDLPTDYIRPSIKSYEGKSYNFTLNAELTLGLRRLAKEKGSTMYMVLLSALHILLSKYSGQDDIVIGSPIAGRPYAELDSMIGVFINTLPMRSQPAGEKVYEAFLEEVRENSFLAYENQEFQFEDLVDRLNVRRDMSRNPLFDVMFTMQNTGLARYSFEHLTFSEYRLENGVAKFDLEFSATEGEEEILVNVEYSTKLFKRETIVRMTEHLQVVLHTITKDKGVRLREIDILSQKEKHKLLHEFNNNAVEFPKQKTLQELLQEQTERTPYRTAVIYEKQSLTYKELNEKSNQIAHMLREKGVSKDKLVGILLERSIDMLVSIIGVLKAGGAYIPMDLDYPSERIRTVLADSGAGIVLTKSQTVNHPASFYDELASGTNVEHIIDLDHFNNASDRYSTENIEFINNPSDMCYVIYTSGSTGRPKGAMIEHIGMINHLFAKINDLKLSEASIVVQNASHCFDISVWQFFAALLCGGTTVIYSNELVKNTEAFVKRVMEDKVTILEVVPSYLNVVLNYLEEREDKLEDLEYLIVTGEELKPKLVKRWFDKYSDTLLVNAYGPTEASDDITHYIMPAYPNDIRVPVGKPLQNLNIYIVDAYLNLCPIGVKGEIVVSGAGVGRGYLHNEEKTRNAFLVNPFVKDRSERLYKTGDLGRWRDDGNIDYLGRIDQQVKIRGHRIELGEIESVINKQTGIKEAVVMVKGDDVESQYLCAYVVLNHTDVQNVRASLKEKLPDYMIPASYIVLDAIPLTSNGKTDRNALLSIQVTNETSNKTPPKNYRDHTIVEIWREVLGLEEIYIQDDFFELGGSSIHVIQAVNQINQALGVNITFADLMANRTVVELSDYIAKQEKDGNLFKHVFKMNKSSSQKNIFIVHGAGGDIFIYKDLAKLLEAEYSVYGIQPKGLNGEEPFPNSYYEMIHDYIKEIRIIQNEGPYIIAGYCIGGIVSFDLVNIFELQGDRVAALIELDHEAFIKKGRAFVRLNSLILRGIELWRRFKKLDKMYTTEKFSKIMFKAKPISKERQIELLNHTENLSNYFGRELVIKSVYNSLGFIESPTLVIKGEDNNHDLLKEELWMKMVKGPLEFHEVPGDHDTVLSPPNVDKVAEIIKNYLN
ncbi:non-ribosomal peptide synthetase [Paenibacillus tengchongensis]|uniref:non-ribosomal peptide synthetase n=1 Tax=Paenibacillus tengchongensis TaxID=2608684 RepID=UPI001651F3E9|nr:non-ribosomal peptide synthetase [Paenibacillus tengchongensis]